MNEPIYTQLFLVKLKSIIDGPILHPKSVVDGPILHPKSVVDGPTLHSKSVVDGSFQYHPVIKLPLHISQCHMVIWSTIWHCLNLLLGRFGFCNPRLSSHDLTDQSYTVKQKFVFLVFLS